MWWIIITVYTPVTHYSSSNCVRHVRCISNGIKSFIKVYYFHVLHLCMKTRLLTHIFLRIVHFSTFQYVKGAPLILHIKVCWLVLTGPIEPLKTPVYVCKRKHLPPSWFLPFLYISHIKLFLILKLNLT